MRFIKFLTIASIILFGLAACNIPSSTKPPDTFATMKAITTAQAATLQTIQTPGSTPTTASSLPTLSFPTLSPLTTATNTPVTPFPTVQIVKTSTPIPPVSHCDWAAYVKDVTIPDGTILEPGEKFTKTWRLQNIGTCTWTTSYDLIFSNGEAMGNTNAVEIPTNIYPNQVVDLSVTLRAPAAQGKHRGYWGLRNASGVIFGIGNSSKEAFYVDIKVVGKMTTIFDFAANYCAADWRSEAGDLGCPGNVNGKKGYAIQVENPKLEDGKKYKGLGILTVPQRVFNGYLKGHYQSFVVRDGDRFRGIINCRYGSNGCSVLFRIEYKIAGEAVKTFWQFPEDYDGKYYTIDLDLSSLAGKKVKFILAVFADGSADDDRPIWVAPRIDRRDNLITPAPAENNTPTPTRTPKVQ